MRSIEEHLRTQILLRRMRELESALLECGTFVVRTHLHSEDRKERNEAGQTLTRINLLLKDSVFSP